jgi:hypothetical protein
MILDTSAETITIIVGVITLMIGVTNSIVTNRQMVKSHHLQIILSVSESFRKEWKAGWGDLLDELEVDHLLPRKESLSDNNTKMVRSMMQWVDWLGAMHSSGALKELKILTTSIGAPTKRIINAGYTILEEDSKTFGTSYWKNLFVVARHLEMNHVIELESS